MPVCLECESREGEEEEGEGGRQATQQPTWEIPCAGVWFAVCLECERMEGEEEGEGGRQATQQPMGDTMCRCVVCCVSGV